MNEFLEVKDVYLVPTNGGEIFRAWKGGKYFEPGILLFQTNKEIAARMIKEEKMVQGPNIEGYLSRKYQRVVARPEDVQGYWKEIKNES